MKNIISTLIMLASLISPSVLNAQVVIGGETGAAGTKTNAVLIDFPIYQNKGLILPYVRQMPTNPAEGTILVDATDTTKARVKYFNGKWQDLSIANEADLTHFVTSRGAVNLMAQQPSAAEDSKAKTIIGARSSTADGVLVLESTTKVMVLPYVANTDDVKDPAPGMMVYITGANKRLAVFNGSKWTFWAPTP